MNSAHVHVGRLLELRAETGFRTAQEVDAIFEVIGRELAKIPAHLRSVNVVDWRRCPIMSADASQHLLTLMGQYNPRVERSATLASRESPTTMLQFIRVVRETKHPERRVFFDEDELREWLTPLLTPAEAARLRAFLAYEEP